MTLVPTPLMGGVPLIPLILPRYTHTHTHTYTHTHTPHPEGWTTFDPIDPTQGWSDGSEQGPSNVHKELTNISTDLRRDGAMTRSKGLLLCLGFRALPQPTPRPAQEGL